MLQQPCAVGNRLPQCQDGARSSTERLTSGGPLISKQQQTCAGLCTKSAIQVGTLGHVTDDIVGQLPAIMLAFCSVNVLRLFGDGGHSEPKATVLAGQAALSAPTDDVASLQASYS